MASSPTLFPLLLTYPLHTLAIVVLVAGIAMLVAARSKRPQSRVGVAAAVVLPLACLGLFASLALRMHAHFGGWPRTIGMEAFPPDLARHADLALGAFSLLVLACVFVWPVASLLCVAVPRLRPGLRYLGLFALSFALVFGAMELAPEGFLAWWWD